MPFFFCLFLFICPFFFFLFSIPSPCLVSLCHHHDSFHWDQRGGEGSCSGIGRWPRFDALIGPSTLREEDFLRQRSEKKPTMTPSAPLPPH